MRFAPASKVRAASRVVDIVIFCLPDWIKICYTNFRKMQNNSNSICLLLQLVIVIFSDCTHINCPIRFARQHKRGYAHIIGGGWRLGKIECCMRFAHALARARLSLEQSTALRRRRRRQRCAHIIHVSVARRCLVSAAYTPCFSKCPAAFYIARAGARARDGNLLYMSQEFCVCRVRV